MLQVYKFQICEVPVTGSRVHAAAVISLRACSKKASAVWALGNYWVVGARNRVEVQVIDGGCICATRSRFGRLSRSQCSKRVDKAEFAAVRMVGSTLSFAAHVAQG